MLPKKQALMLIKKVSQCTVEIIQLPSKQHAQKCFHSATKRYEYVPQNNRACAHTPWAGHFQALGWRKQALTMPCVFQHTGQPMPDAESPKTY